MLLRKIHVFIYVQYLSTDLYFAFCHCNFSRHVFFQLQYFTIKV